MSRSGVRSTTASISKNTRRASGRSVRAPRAATSRHPTSPTTPMAVLSQEIRVRNVAAYRAGMVTMSAVAVISGVDTASMS
jgi:hypothetical protein